MDERREFTVKIVMRMPKGQGTYGKKRGRPSKRNKNGVPRKKLKKRRVKKGEKGTYRKKDGKLRKKR
mgnify:CR=1 FL=1